MSGFEIAGVVLGALPLLISAAEHYQSGLDPAIAFFKWKDELKKALRELWLQHSSFQLTLRNLLKEVASPSETDEMLSDFQHELWKSSELANRLERRLNVAYKVYIYMMQEMESCLRTLAGHLDIDRKKGTLNDLEAILQANPPALSSGQGPPRFEFRSRIKFTMRRKEIRNLLKEIKSCNERLDQFIEKAQKTQPAPQHAEKPKICPTVQQIQEYATNLHEILSGAWSCAPRGSHQVRLILEHRMVRPKKELALRVSHDDQDTACFTLSCSGPSSPENWNLAEIRVTAKTTSHQPQVSKNKPVSKSLSPVSNSNGSAAGKTQIVKDLCPFFCRQSHPGCLGFELNPDGKLWGVYQAESRTILHSESCVTLEEILFPPQDNNQCKPFTEEDRYVLAITIASSMLQLHVTPWLTGYWSKRNILFTRHTDTQQVVVDISHPFISMDYQQKSGNNSDPTATAQNLLDSYDDDSMNFLTLAKLLLEIKLGNKFQYPSPGDKNGHASDFLELKRWIVREKGNLSFAYRDAVSYCMQCAVNPAIELKDAGFRQKMVDYVVVPLLNELDYWRGGVL